MIGQIFASIFSFALFMLVLFIFVTWFWLLISVIQDLFRRTDVGGFGTVMWIIFLVLLPYLGVFIYLISQGSGMAERNVAQMRKAQQDLRTFVGFSPADELAKLEKLKADGVLSADEYARLRAKALA